MKTARWTWHRLHDNLAPDVVVAHECNALGWIIRVETRFTRGGSVCTYVNGKPYGEPLYHATRTQAVRRHLRILQQIKPLRQARLPLS